MNHRFFKKFPPYKNRINKPSFEKNSFVTIQEVGKNKDTHKLRIHMKKYILCFNICKLDTMLPTNRCMQTFQAQSFKTTIQLRFLHQRSYRSNLQLRLKRRPNRVYSHILYKNATIGADLCFSQPVSSNLKTRLQDDLQLHFFRKTQPQYGLQSRFYHMRLQFPTFHFHNT